MNKTTLLKVLLGYQFFFALALMALVAFLFWGEGRDPRVCAGIGVSIFVSWLVTELFVFKGRDIN